MSKRKIPIPIPVKTTGSPMDVALLEQMVRMMAANDLNTIDVRDGDRRVILRRGVAAATGPMPAPATYASTAPAPVTNTPTGPTAPATTPADEAGLVAIKSPMVGTFYSSPSPDSKPFVTVGSTVDEETDVCTIEAMKNFLPIKAETRGTIAKILVTNGQSVQFGQNLFLVKV